jgi:hypothetical protein
MATRADIIKQARHYLKTPFQHQARVRGVGMDCVGLILSIGEDLKLLDSTGVAIRRNDYLSYSAQPSDSFVQEEMKRRLILKPWQSMQPGDAVTMKLPFHPCHAGIISENSGMLYIVHAFGGIKYEVTEHIIDEQWRHRICCVFSWPGVE